MPVPVTPNRIQYPVVADPTGTEINQAWFNLHFSDHDFKLGLQRIVFDNQRFIGGVAWRQNEKPSMRPVQILSWPAII